MNARREACTKSVVVAMAMEMEAVNGQPAKVSQRQPTDPSKGVIIIWVVGKKERKGIKRKEKDVVALLLLLLLLMLMPSPPSLAV